MNSKKTVLLLIVLTVSIVFTGCDAINGAFDSVFLSTTEVEAKDLADFSGDAPTSDDDVLEGFYEGMYMAMNPATELIPKSLGSDYEEVVRMLDLTIPGFADSRAAEIDSRAASFGVDVSITDEVFPSDYEDGDYFDPGKLTVTEASVSIGLEADTIDTDEMEEAEADFSAKLELILEDVVDYNYNYSTGEYDEVYLTLNELNFNVNSKGNLKATIGDDGPESVDFYAAADVSIGFSLSATDSTVSGKYIFNFNYVQSGTVTADDLEEGDMTGDAEEISITIEVYDNDNVLVRSVSYNQTELTELMTDFM